jgi:hypothetical protein
MLNVIEVRAGMPNSGDGFFADEALSLNYQEEVEMGVREDYQSLMERQLNEWKKFTERLRTQADQFETQAKGQFDQQLETMRAKQNEAWDNFMKLKSANEEAWGQWKNKLDQAWNEMKTASDRLVEQLRKK